jgi:hypothetical protein
MKGFEITSAMKQGKLFVFAWNTSCEVLHQFRHISWIRFKGQIKSVRHKFLEFDRIEKGESSHRMVRLTTGKEFEILDKLRKEYESIR